MKAFVFAVAVMMCACEGPMGPRGLDGANGLPGPTGAQGPGLVLVLTTHCQGTISIGSSGFLITHDVYDYSDGSTLANCMVYNGTVAAQGTFLWSSGKVGANEGSCLAAADADAPSYGFWAFALASSGTASRVTYTDAFSASDQRIFGVNCATQ